MTGDAAALLERRPSCVPGLRISAPVLRGTALVYILQDPQTGRVLEVRSKEHFLITMLDGSRSLGEIGEQYAARFGSALGPQQWQQMLTLLYRRGLLSTGMSADAPVAAGAPVPTGAPAATVASVPAGAPVAARAPVGAGAADAHPATSPPGSGTVLRGKVRLVADSQSLIERLYRVTAFVRRRQVAVGIAVVVAAMLALVSARLGELTGDVAYLMARPQLLLPVLTVLWVTQGMHELGHGIAARALGGRASEIGLRWNWGTVLMYCRVEGVPFFPRRGQVTVALAGVYVNLLALVPFAAVWSVLPAGGPARQTAGGLVAIGLVWGLANLIPLPPLDGYKALCYRLGVDRLATESRRYARLAALHRLRRGPAPAGYTARMRLLYGGYAAVLVALPLVLTGVAVGSTGVYLRDHFGRGALFAGAAVLGGVIVLWALGMVFARVRARRRADSDRPVHDPGDQPGPAHPRSLASTDESTRPRKGMRPLSEHRPDPGAAAIEIRDVRKEYGGVAAVEGVSLTIGQGEFFGLIGPNGAGKTTLIEMICGLRRPDSGSVTVLGSAPWPRDVALLSRIGVQTQASAFFTRLTALEHLGTVAALYDLDRGSALAALDLVGLANQAKLRVTALSGGQRQRLAIASALVQNPELVFLDEPTAALDPEARRDLWGLLRTLKERGHTVVYTTHHLEEAEALCDRVAIMARGSVVACDTPANLMRTLDAPTRLYVPAATMTPDAARAITGVDRAFVDGGELVIETCDLGPVLVAVGQTVGFDAVRTRTASLEDAYLALIGTDVTR